MIRRIIAGVFHNGRVLNHNSQNPESVLGTVVSRGYHRKTRSVARWDVTHVTAGATYRYCNQRQGNECP